MTFEELVPNINIESEIIEFKGLIEEGIENNKRKELSWLSVIASFANTKGGTLYIGVDNKTHKILSLDHNLADKTILMIHRLIKERIAPTIVYLVNTIPIKDETNNTRYVIEVKVEKSLELPVIVKVSGLLGIYIREYGKTRESTPQEITNLVLSSKEKEFDTIINDEIFNINDYKTMSDEFFKNKNKNINIKDFYSTGAITSDNKVKNGLLLFKDSYKSNTTKIVCNLWPSSDKSTAVLLDTKEFIGNIIEGIYFGINFVNSHSANGYKKTKDGRIDYISYPKRSLLEAIVNAFAHRNYFMDHFFIEVNMFVDRLEIISPGLLIGTGTITKEKNIHSIIPRVRNEIITNILCLLNLMEKRGSGFDLIEEEYKGYGDKYSPYISSKQDSFTITLPNLTYSGLISDEIMPNVYIDTLLSGKHDLKILSFCYNYPKTISEIASILKIKPTTYFRKEVIGNLVKNNYLIEGIIDNKNKYTSNHKKVFIK